jgi:hypothetical protein
MGNSTGFSFSRYRNLSGKLESLSRSEAMFESLLLSICVLLVCPRVESYLPLSVMRPSCRVKPIHDSNNNSPSYEGFHLNKSKKFISPYLQQRMVSGKLSPQELEKYFPFSSRELQAMKKGPAASKGLIGVIVSLEDVLVDVREIYCYSYSYFFQSASRPVPSDAQIIDTIGEPFIHICI